MVNLYVVYELNICSQDLNAEFTLKNCLFGNVRVTNNAEPNKYPHIGCGIGFDSHSHISLPNDFGKNVIFGVDMSSSVYPNRNNKDILILGKGKTKGVDYTTLTVESKYSINFWRSQRKFYLTLHYNRSNSFLFVNATEISQFNAKESELKRHPLCLGNISKNFSVGNIEKTGLNEYVYDFSVNCNAIALDDTLDIHKYLMKNHDIKNVWIFFKKGVYYSNDIF